MLEDSYSDGGFCSDGGCFSDVGYYCDGGRCSDVGSCTDRGCCIVTKVLVFESNGWLYCFLVVDGERDLVRLYSERSFVVDVLSNALKWSRRFVKSSTLFARSAYLWRCDQRCECYFHFFIYRSIVANLDKGSVDRPCRNCWTLTDILCNHIGVRKSSWTCNGPANDATIVFVFDHLILRALVVTSTHLYSDIDSLWISVCLHTMYAGVGGGALSYFRSSVRI